MSFSDSPERKGRVYLIGIGGSGMEPLARFAVRAGYTVHGSDPGIAPEKLRKLEGEGVLVHREHDAAHVNAGYDLVVYSSAIAADHVEREAARRLADERRLRLLHRMDFLNVCFQDCPEALCVAGTHGKTSSSSMIGWALQGLGLEPHILVGGRPLFLLDGVLYGTGRTGVYETDESDGSFLKAKARLRLLLNVDHDHLEHYGSFANLSRAFAEFAAAGELTVYNASDANLAAAVRDAGLTSNENMFSCAAGEAGDTPAGRHYAGVSLGESDALRVHLPGESRAAGELQLRMPGRHFAGNALGVLALIDASVQSGLLQCPDYRVERLITLLNEFPGVERRMELLGDIRGASYYDDYGHHPTEIRAVLAAFRRRLPAGRKLLAVFQPHRYSRTAEHYAAFAQALRGADRLFLLPLYSAGEAPRPGVSSELIAGELERLRAAGERVPETDLLTANDARAFEHIAAEASAGDVVACLGAGDISCSVRAFYAQHAPA